MSQSEKIKEACTKFWAKDQKKYQRGKKNQKPEETVVEKHLEFFSKNDWFVNRYESKAVKKYGGYYDQTSLVIGHPDLLGVTPQGKLIALELKAPGKRATLRPHQRVFLVETIKREALGLVSDSLEYTLSTYHAWLKCDDGVSFLLNELPIDKSIKDCPF